MVFYLLIFFFHGAPPVEESETAAKQKWQQQFGIRVSSRTLGKRERKRGKDECVPVGRGQLVERQPWVQSGGLISLSFVTHLLLGLINPPRTEGSSCGFGSISRCSTTYFEKNWHHGRTWSCLGHCSLPGFSSLMLILLRFFSFGFGYFLFSASTAAPWFNLHISFDFPSSMFLFLWTFCL